ncbi:MAG: group II intron reverse transcriptase/maturase [Gemmatimonadales bacterium]
MSPRPRSGGGGTALTPGAEGAARGASGEQAGDGTTGLMEEVLRRENVLRAYRRVVRNGGAAGADGMTVEQLGPYCRAHWARIREALGAGTYEPQPGRRVEIPKPDGRGRRVLGIPTVVDRLIQQAVLQVLDPLFDPTFSDGSFGFRRGRGTQGAVARAREHIAAGHRWVVDLDLERFFDRVNHDVLMARVAKRVRDKRVLQLSGRFLRAGMLEGGMVSPRLEGTPQGGPLSPLLSNVLLDELDKELERRGHRYVRYADDCNVYVQSEAAGRRVMASLERFLQERLRLKVNRDKSAVARPWSRTFLGYTVTAHRQPKLKPARQAVQRLKGTLRRKLRAGRGRHLGDTVRGLAPIVRGWVAYFRQAAVKASFAGLDAWLRRKLRGLVWRQWKTPRTRLRELCRRGIARLHASAVVYGCRGPWASAGTSAMIWAVSPTWLTQLGLVSFLDEHRRLACAS